MTFKKSFKKAFQPLEIALRKVFGIKKLVRGELFTPFGEIKEGFTKSTRFVLWLPVFVKFKQIVNVNEFGTNSCKMGGGGNSEPQNSTLYTIKTKYKFLGILIYCKSSTQIIHHQIHTKTSLWVNPDLGKYIVESPNIEEKIFALINGLSPENQAFVLRQIARTRQAYKNNTHAFYFADLTPQEQAEYTQIQHEFFPNILKLSDKLFYYDGYFLPTNFVEISVFWHRHSLAVLQTQTLEKMRKQDFIDVGGCIGDSAVIFEREFTEKNVYCFEPTHRNFALMQKTIALNNATRVKGVNLGLGAEKGELEIEYNFDNIGGSTGVSKFMSGKETETAKITTLDDFVCENKLDNIGFIKVDIEGFEMQFLQGAKNTICTQKPAMLISIYHQGSDYFDIKPLIESWDLGYKFKIHKGTDGSLTGETALFCEILE